MIKKLDTGQVVFTKPSHLFVTPWIDQDTPGANTYDIVAIIADSISIEQDDPTTNTTEWEFGDSPLFETVTLGNYNLTATCIDFQADVMTNIYGWTKDTNTGLIVAPVSYSDRWASVRIQFQDGTPDVFMPKIKLSSKAAFASMKTSQAQGTISGTGYAAAMTATRITPDTTGTTYTSTKTTSIAILGSDANVKINEIEVEHSGAYKVSFAAPTTGKTISVDAPYYAAGDTVNVTTTGGTVSSMKYKEGSAGTEKTVTGNTFEMPANNVILTVTFS